MMMGYNFLDHTPMEILGSNIYKTFGRYMAPISLFCTVFSHLDWESFAKIAKECQTNDLTKEDSLISE